MLSAPRTFWAWRDKVVLNTLFNGDVAPAFQVKGVSHISICKPNGKNQTIEQLLEVIP